MSAICTAFLRSDPLRLTVPDGGCSRALSFDRSLDAKNPGLRAVSPSSHRAVIGWTPGPPSILLANTARPAQNAGKGDEHDAFPQPPAGRTPDRRRPAARSPGPALSRLQSGVRGPA